MFYDGFNSWPNIAEEGIRCLKTGQYVLSKLKYKQGKKKSKMYVSAQELKQN